MKTKIFIVVALSLSAVIKAQSIEDNLKAINNELDMIRYEVNANNISRERILESVANIKKIIGLREHNYQYPGNTNSNYNAPRAMSDEEFSNLVASASTSINNDIKFDIIKALTPKYTFKVKQIVALLKLMDFPGNKWQIVELCVPRVDDPANISILLKEFLFDSDKEKIIKMLPGK